MRPGVDLLPHRRYRKNPPQLISADSLICGPLISNLLSKLTFTSQVVLLRLDVLFIKRSACHNQALNMRICNDKFKIPFPWMFLELSSDLLLQ